MADRPPALALPLAVAHELIRACKAAVEAAPGGRDVVGVQLPTEASEGAVGEVGQFRIWAWPISPSAAMSVLLSPSVTAAMVRQ